MRVNDFWVWPYRENRQAVSAVLGILLTFHTMLVISLAIPENQAPGMTAHAVMVVLCMSLYTQDPSGVHDSEPRVLQGRLAVP